MAHTEGDRPGAGRSEAVALPDTFPAPYPDPASDPGAASEALSRELHVWLLDPASVGPRTLDRWTGTLSDAELGRYRRYMSEKDRHLFLTAHGFTRETLSRYAELDPGAWLFTENEHGRPEPSIPDTAQVARTSGLRFNLSHTDGLVALLIHGPDDAGVDVEQVGRVADFLQVSRRVFSEQERSALLELPEDERERRFYVYWTLKESYIKARGMGLALPLRSFWFGSESPAPCIGFTADFGDDPARWSFLSREVGASHLLAVAHRHEPGSPDRSVRFLRR